MPPARSRDREATEALILTAARQVLAEGGFQGLGVNAVARAAGCDKQLIYRYYGGLDGLVAAVGEDLANWWTEALRPLLDLPPAQSYAELMERLALGFLDALRADPLVQKIVAWEIADNSEQVRNLSLARARGLGQWMQAARGDLAPPPGVDAAAANAVIVAAVQHLVLAGAVSGRFTGLPLTTDADWDRVRDSLRRIVRALY